ncbi:FRG domain-containing protein [Vibrio ruber]|uniref:FRG domain-containing protein n=1 Tax=Vibrio ruber TaxID=184755 RepID=UPI002892ABE5|nr:FRG domain-containing protein [Vibrio ruber]WNJ97260.1 FRG domain-containing protein [Vibrio ruber]
MIEAEETLSSITACLNKKAISFQTTWFRGQPNYEHKLVPSIFRQGSSFGAAYHEQKMFEEFKRRYPDQSNSHKNTYEWFTLIQHYRLPTRMEAMYELNEFLESAFQEKSLRDFFNRIIYQLDHMLDGSCKLNGISIQELRNDLYIRSKFCGLSTDSTVSFDSLELKTELLNTQDFNEIPFRTLSQMLSELFLISFLLKHRTLIRESGSNMDISHSMEECLLMVMNLFR